MWGKGSLEGEKGRNDVVIISKMFSKMFANFSSTEMKCHKQGLFYYLICGLSLYGAENQCPTISLHVLFYASLS